MVYLQNSANICLEQKANAVTRMMYLLSTVDSTSRFIRLYSGLFNVAKFQLTIIGFGKWLNYN